jgi:hypothetical protein
MASHTVAGLLVLLFPSCPICSPGRTQSELPVPCTVICAHQNLPSVAPKAPGPWQASAGGPACSFGLWGLWIPALGMENWSLTGVWGFVGWWS